MRSLESLCIFNEYLILNYCYKLAIKTYQVIMWTINDDESVKFLSYPLEYFRDYYSHKIQEMMVL